MVEKILGSISKEDLFKLLGVTLFFFLLFSLIHRVGERNTSMIQVDYLAQEVKKLTEGGEHPSAEVFSSQLQLEKICSQDPQICQKVVYSGDFSDDEKLKYIGQYFSIFSFIDQHKTKGDPLASTLKTFLINAHKGKRRGGATASRITINLASMGETSEYRGVLSHEFGHVVDLGSLQGKSKYKNENYTEFGKARFSIDDPSLEYYRYSRASEEVRKDIAQKKDFCSGYGMTNPFEDFAECHNLYLNNASLFRQMAQESNIMKNKYNYLANLFANAKLTNGSANLLYPSWRPWDTTVL